MRKGKTVYRAYLAGIMDGEGCFTTKGKRNLLPVIKITNTNQPLLLDIQQILIDFGIHIALYKHWKKKPHPTWKDQWALESTSMKETLALAKFIQPHLIAKQRQCQIAIEILKFHISRGNTGSRPRKKMKNEGNLYQELRTLNKRGA